MESTLKNLDNDTFRLLCYLAYHGEISDSHVITEYCKIFRESKTRWEKERNVLEEQGFLQHGTFISPAWHLCILNELYLKNAALIEKFRNIGTYSRRPLAEYLSRLSQQIIREDFEGAAKISKPYVGVGPKTINLYPYIQPLFAIDARYMSLVNDDEFWAMTSEMFLEKFINDQLDDSILKIVEDNLPTRRDHTDDLKEEIAAYRYFLYGIREPLKTNGMWALAINGIENLYQGNTGDAVDYFNRAVKMQNAYKNAFASPILNYFYGIALYKNTKRGGDVEYPVMKLSIFRQTQTIRLGDDNILIRILLDNIESSYEKSTSDVETRTDYLLHRKNTPMHWSMCCMACDFFGAKLSEDGIPHSAKIIQHEMSKWLPLGPVAKHELQEIYGGNAIITTLRRRTPWEIALSDVTEKVSKQKYMGARKRIVYYVQGIALQNIEEQTLNESGIWESRKLLSLLHMANEGYDSMDATDVMVASALTHMPPESTELDVLVAQLKDTDRLFIGQNYDGKAIQAVICRESPKLIFKGSGLNIVVSTNCKVSTNGTVMKHSVRREDKNTFTLISVNPLQKDIMSRVLRQGTFPSSAIVSLRNTIKSLNGIVDVVDNIPDEMFETAIMSQGVIAVRVVPDKDEFKISLMATALENGQARLIPAEGDSLVFDEADGFAHCINRDMAKEYENYLEIHDFIDNLTSSEIVSYTESRIWKKDEFLNLLDYVYNHRDKFFIEWPEGKSLKLRGVITASDIDISVASDMEWFTVEGEVKTNTLRISLDALIRSCCSNDVEGFIKLSDDEYVKMSEELKKHIAAMKALFTHGRRKKSIPKYQVGALASMINGLNVQKDGEYRAFEQKTKEAFSTKTPLPVGLNGTLRNYQEEGFQWMCRLSAWGAGACLADDMGLGKTIQAITFMLHKAEEGPSLVVAPKSVLLNWSAEIQKFAPSLNVINLNTETKRRQALSKVNQRDIVLCTYGVLGTQGSLITAMSWNVVCLDEAHQIKNRNTNVSRTAMEIKASSKLILTGTPLQNNLGELWNLFQFINPGLLGSWPVVRDSFMIPGLDQRHKDLLREMTMPFILRRTKEDVLNELPEKIIHEQMIELTDSEMKVYEEMRRLAEVKFKKHKTKAEREEAKGLDLNFFQELTKLRLGACSMKLVHDGWTEQSSKIDELLRILENLMDNPDNNIVVFSQFTKFLDMVKPELKKRSMEFLYLDGQTPLEKRQKYVEDFQNGKCRLFLSSLKAGGLGVNLTKANYIILLDPWWNPAIENQAMDRAHRLGQKRIVSVIRLISSQTIEEKILRMHAEKQHLTDDILEGTGESHKLTYEDIMDMVAPF